MNLNDIMTREIKTIGPDSTLTEAAKLMDELNVGDIPVCEGDNLIGIITDRDMVIRSISAGQDPNSTKVRDAMTSPVVSCREDASMDEAAKLMKQHQIRRLPILNEQGKIIGVVSLGDIVVESGNKELGGDVLKKVSEPVKPAA